MSDDLEEFNKVYGAYLQGKADAIDEMQNPKNLVCYEDKFLHCPCCDEALSYKWDKYPIKTIFLTIQNIIAEIEKSFFRCELCFPVPGRSQDSESQRILAEINPTHKKDPNRRRFLSALRRNPGPVRAPVS